MILMCTLIYITSTNSIELVTSQHIVRWFQILMFFMTINAVCNDNWSLTNLWRCPIWKRLHSFGESIQLMPKPEFQWNGYKQNFNKSSARTFFIFLRATISCIFHFEWSAIHNFRSRYYDKNMMQLLYIGLLWYSLFRCTSMISNHLSYTTLRIF